MKGILLMMSLMLMSGCGSSTPKQVQVNEIENTQIEAATRVEVSQKLYDELFRIIDLNDVGKMPDSEFKPQAAVLKQKIDENDALLTDDQKILVKTYGQQLLDELVTKKMGRTN